MKPDTDKAVEQINQAGAKAVADLKAGKDPAEAKAEFDKALLEAVVSNG